MTVQTYIYGHREDSPFRECDKCQDTAKQNGKSRIFFITKHKKITRYDLPDKSVWDRHVASKHQKYKVQKVSAIRNPGEKRKQNSNLIKKKKKPKPPA